MMFARSITKTVTASVLALSLAMTTIAPTPAAADNRDDALLGVLTLLLLGAAIHNSQNDDRDTVRPYQPPRNGNWRNLPSQCQFTINVRGGGQQRMFGRRCMENNYRQLSRLPDRCYVRVHNIRGQVRQGWRPRCLRNEGFRVNWR